MNVSENLPDNPKEISEEYHKRSKELKELQSDPDQIKGRTNGIYEHAPRLRQIEEDTYTPSKNESGIITEPLFDDDGEFLGVIQDIDDRFLTAEERLARGEVDRLRGRPTWLETRLGLLRIMAAAKEISLEDSEIDAIKLKPGRKANPKIAERKEIVRKHIKPRQDLADHSKLEQLFLEFDQKGIPEPENTHTKTKLFVGLWQEEFFTLTPRERRRIVEILNRDRWPRRKAT